MVSTQVRILSLYTSFIPRFPCSLCFFAPDALAYSRANHILMLLLTEATVLPLAHLYLICTVISLADEKIYYRNVFFLNFRVCIWIFFSITPLHVE